MKTIICIPAKNESKTIGYVVKKTRKFSNWVYVFDDGSNDSTGIIATKNGARTVHNPVNLGKGATVRYALRWLIDNKLFDTDDIVIFLDADNQHDANLIPKFIETMNTTGANLVVGKRDLSDYPFYKKLGNSFLNSLSSFLSGLKIEDSESGYRAFDYNLAIDILRYSSSKRYGIEIESNIICGNKSCTICGMKGCERKGKLIYIPIKSKYAGEKGTKFKDGLMNALNGVICFVKIKATR